MTLFSFMMERKTIVECTTNGKVACTKYDLDYCKCIYPKTTLGNFVKTLLCDSPKKPQCIRLKISPYLFCKCIN